MSQQMKLVITPDTDLRASELASIVEKVKFEITLTDGSKKTIPEIQFKTQ